MRASSSSSFMTLLLLACSALLAHAASVHAQAACGFDGYDFSSLSGHDIKGSDGTAQYSYLLNVCGAVTSQPGCTANQPLTSACQIQASTPTYFYDIGLWGGPGPVAPVWGYIDAARPQLGVQLNMTGTQDCWATEQPTLYYTTVNFVCAREQGALTVSVPQGGCTQVWTLPTPLACPQPPPPPSACGFDGYDFSSLSTADLPGSDGTSTYSYLLRLCGVLSTQPACHKADQQVSACQVDRNDPNVWVTGEWNAASAAQWSYIDPKTPALGVMLNMTGAQECWATGQPEFYYTLVDLVCARTEGQLTVTLTRYSCIQTYTLPTPLACPEARGSEGGGVSIAKTAEELRSLFISVD